MKREQTEGLRREKRGKQVVLLLIVLMLMIWVLPFRSEAATKSVAGTWKKDSKGWYYQFKDGSGKAKSEYIKGRWVNAKGYREKKWDGKWCHNAKGWWFQAGSWYPKKKWVTIDRKTYYFNASGYMVTNQWIGRRYVNKDGVWTKTRAGKLVEPKTSQLKKPAYPAGSPAKKWGALQVKGTKIVNSAGTAVQLKGVSTFGIIWDEGRYNINLDGFKTVKSWGANAIRLAVYTEEYGGYCVDWDSVKTSELNKTIANAVSYATKLGMYVIIDWHILNDGNPNTHIKEAKQFFADMSYKYGKYTNVLYEICNEPNNTDWASVKSYADTIIPIIRENDSDAIILVGTPTWSQDVDLVAKNPVKKTKNVMYVLHFYASTHGDNIRSKLKTALKNGTPVFVSEFSICAADGNGSIDYTSAAAWKKLINSNKVSYIGWSLSNKNETSALIKNSCSKHSGWKDSDLTETGKYLKKWIQGK